MLDGFATRLKTAMNKLGFKRQYEMADALGISRGYFSEVLQGKKIPSDIILKMMEIKLALRSEWLNNGTGTMIISKEEWERITPYPTVGPIYLTDNHEPSVKKKGEYPFECQSDLIHNNTACSPEIDPVMDAFIEVMTSEDEDTKGSLARNVFTFLRTVRNEKKITVLERRIEELESAIEIIKKQLSCNETDFKSQGS